MNPKVIEQSQSIAGLSVYFPPYAGTKLYGLVTACPESLHGICCAGTNPQCFNYRLGVLAVKSTIHICRLVSHLTVASIHLIFFIMALLSLYVL